MALQFLRNAPILMEILPESTVLESLSCPSCFTHYGLRPERVHPGIRRARCFRCGELFGIEDVIERILAPTLAEASPTATLEGIQPEDLLELDATLSAPPPAPAPLEVPPPVDSALTLGDLEGTEDEILEKTLVIEPAAAPDGTDGDGAEGTGAYASAKDAIARLLGDAPPSAAPDRRGSGRGNSMDVEATLDALENTLGGTPTKDLAGRPTLPRQEPGAPAMGSTVRLSPTELQAAMAAGATSSTPASQAPTVAIPSLASTRPAFVPQPQAPAEEAPGAGDPNLLKIQVGQETFQNVTLDQLASWIEQGRVQDWHMVARQFSDNWIEAGKVPSLRPVFERVRRMAPATPATAPDPHASSPLDTAPVKKSLFGWMSNRS